MDMMLGKQKQQHHIKTFSEEEIVNEETGWIVQRSKRNNKIRKI